MHYQSRLPGTEPWYDRKTGSWPRTNSDLESVRSSHRSDPEAYGSPKEAKDLC